MKSKRQKNAEREAARQAQARKDGAAVCGAQKRDNKGPCGMPAGHGTDHPGQGRCASHGGQSRSHQIMAAHAEINGMARARRVSPVQAIQAALGLAAGQLAYATEKVGALKDDELHETFINRETGIPQVLENVWFSIQKDAMKEMSRYAKLAADMGIAERDMSMKEAQTQIMAQLLQGVLGQLGLTEEQKKLVSPAIRATMSQMGAPGVPEHEIIEGQVAA